MNRLSAVIVQGAALESEIPSLSVPQFVRDRARQQPDRIAFIDGLTGRQYSYGDLDRSIGRCGLLERNDPKCEWSPRYDGSG